MWVLRAAFFVVGLVLETCIVPATICRADAIADAYTGSFTIPVVSAQPKQGSSLDDDAWKLAATIPITYNLRTRKPDQEPAIVHAMTDGKNLYFAFDVTQHEAITADYHQNDAGLGNDDAVSVYLYPSGPTGFVYVFQANPIGTHVASSSENTAYAPTWQSFGQRTSRGYVVTMRIPLQSIKSEGRSRWRVNFRRTVGKTLDDVLWSYSPNAVAGNDPPPVAAGTMSGLVARSTSPRPQPRFGVYSLGQAAAGDAGGTTSRLGADVSIPITGTSTLLATVHPDYSNVEIDQQSIAPTAFPRYINDVRPFFTQLQNYYNGFTCYTCAGLQPLYTTAIPTPRYGYALEGKQGPLSFAAFDAVGVGRDDNAEVLGLQSSDSRWNGSLQHGSTAAGGLLDVVSTEAASYDSKKGFEADLAQAQERGTLVTNDAQANWSHLGMGLYDQTQSLYAALQSVGTQFAPLDGYVPNNGIGGYSANYSKTWYRAKDALIPRILFYGETDLYHSPTGGIGQSDNQLALGLDLQRFMGLPQLVHVRAQVGSSFLRLGDGALVPVSQNGLNFAYGYRTAVPLNLSYFTGRFGPGTLRYTTGSAGYIFHRDVTFGVEVDNGTQFVDDGSRNIQWLERASITWQPGRTTSLVLGTRRIIGTAAQLELGSPQPYVDAYNLSAGFYKRWPHDEFYAVYGDASQLTTTKRFVLKLIHYFGAEKGA
jgi:hypothetical protein